MKGLISIIPLLLSSSLLVTAKPSSYSEDYEDQYWRTWSIGQAPTREEPVSHSVNSFNPQQNYQPWAGYQEPVYQPEQSWQPWNAQQKPSQELPVPPRNQKPSENVREPQPWQESAKPDQTWQPWNAPQKPSQEQPAPPKNPKPSENIRESQPWQESAKPVEKPFVQEQQYYYNQNTDRKPVNPYVPENPWINHESAVPNVPQQNPQPSWQQNVVPQSNNVQDRPSSKPQPNNPSWDSQPQINKPAQKPVAKPPQVNNNRPEQSYPARPQQETPAKPNRPQPSPPQPQKPSPVPAPPQQNPNNNRVPQQPNREIRNKPAPSYNPPQQQQYRPPPPQKPAQNHYDNDSEESYEIVTGRPDSRCPRVDNPRKPVDLPVFGNCRKFMKCYGGMAYEMNCPADLQFSVEKSRCDYPGVANCRA